jgi:hypothetical protein
MPMMAKRAALDMKATTFLRSSLPATTFYYPRFFSSEAQSNLIEILAREEKEEKDAGNLKMPEELASLKSNLESTWKMVEEGGTMNLFLKDRKVQLSFHCQDTVEADPLYDDVEAEDEEEPVAPVRFCVTASKAGKTLVINCVSDYGEAKIEGVMTTTSAPDAIHSNQGDLPEKNQYQGPDFLELSEDLQDAFAKYLEDECAVDSDVSAFVAMYADYQEQMQYAKFLKDAQLIVS